MEIQPKVRKRPDRVRKVKETTYTVVKTTWNAFCKKSTKIVFPIESIIKNVNLITFEAYKLANLHVLRSLENDLEIPTFDQNFFYNCLVGVGYTFNRKNQDVKDTELLQSIREYDKLKPDDYKCGYKDNMGAYFNNVSRQMKTCFKNSFDANFYKRMVKYVKRKNILWTKYQVYLFLKDVYDQNYNGFDAEVWKLKDKMGYKYPDLSSSLKLQKQILDFMSRCNMKLFTMLPNRGHFTINYVEICTSCLHDTLIAQKLTKLGNKEFMEKKDEFWRGMFNVEQFETENRKFHYEIMTDGKGVSVVLTKPLRASKDHPVNVDDYDKIWGLDPGRREMFVCSDEEHNVVRCTTKEYYHDTKIYYSNKKIKKWYGEDAKISTLFSNMPTLKTSKVDDMKVYLMTMFQNIHYLFDFHWKKRFRDLKFTRFVMAQKKLYQLCKKIANKGNVLVGFGDWSNNDKCIKGHSKGPVEKFKAELKKYCKVVDVDEYLTSKLCHNCKCETENMRFNVYDEHNKKQSSKKVHSVLCCKNTQCERNVMNRDVNASRNILEILMSTLTSKIRPICFRR